MKSWHYMAIFIAVVVIVSGFLVYYSRTITEIDSDMITIDDTKNSVQKKEEINVQIKQEKIDVLADEDLEFDGEDLLVDESADFGEIEELMAEETVTL